MAQARVSSTDEVLAAATRVFLTKGFESSTIEDIARAANISKPTVYQYSKGKQWLLDHSVELICDVLIEGQRKIIAADAPAAVRMQWLIETSVQFAVTYRGSFRLTFTQQTALSPEAREKYHVWALQITAEFGDLLAECRDEGSLHWPGDISHATNLVFTMLNSTHRWFHPNDEVSVADLAAEIGTLLSGVLTSPDMSEWPLPPLAQNLAEGPK